MSIFPSESLVAADSPLARRYMALAAEAFRLGITPEPVGFPCERDFLVQRGRALRAMVAQATRNAEANGAG